jgi:hypothetical protein
MFAAKGFEKTYSGLYEQSKLLATMAPRMNRHDAKDAMKIGEILHSLRGVSIMKNLPILF